MSNHWPHTTNVSTGGKCIAQGEKTVGNGHVRLVASSTPCSKVWIGAPTGNHTKATTNNNDILIGTDPTSNASGGIQLANDNGKGIVVDCEDAMDVTLTGFSEGDAVEYQIWK